jgi:hypothetical protein
VQAIVLIPETLHPKWRPWMIAKLRSRSLATLLRHGSCVLA